MTTITNQDTPLTLTAIQQFRNLLDVMEEFVRNTEIEALEEISASNCTKPRINKTGEGI